MVPLDEDLRADHNLSDYRRFSYAYSVARIMMPSRLAILALAAAGMFAAAPVSAQATGTVVLTNPGSVTNTRATGTDPLHSYAAGSFYVSPYLGTLDGQQVFLYCVDFTHNVGVGDVWTVNVTSLGADFTGNTTRFNNAAAYRQAAWMITHSGGYSAEDVQDAVWKLFYPALWAENADGTPTNPEFGNAANLLSQAQLQGQSVDDFSSFLILTDNTPDPVSGARQEFLIVTPEPATVALFATGLLGIIGVARRRKNTA